MTVTKPSFASEVPPLSIDNDTDGVLDSKWLDVGFPMLTDESGTQYKAKAAYYVLDLDGRLNVNAHGGAEPLDDTDPLWAVPAHLSVPTSFATLPAGSNYGVSEIHLRELFPVIAIESQLSVVKRNRLFSDSMSKSLERRVGS